MEFYVHNLQLNSEKLDQTLEKLRYFETDFNLFGQEVRLQSTIIISSNCNKQFREMLNCMLLH